jgi:hypothetical protein
VVVAGRLAVVVKPVFPVSAKPYVRKASVLESVFLFKPASVTVENATKPASPVKSVTKALASFSAVEDEPNVPTPVFPFKQTLNTVAAAERSARLASPVAKASVCCSVLRVFLSVVMPVFPSRPIVYTVENATKPVLLVRSAQRAFAP